MKVHASLVLIASVSHAVWNRFLPTYMEMKGLTEIQWNVLFMFNWAVALFLLLLSIFSFWISTARSFALPQLRIFSALIIGFWICRLVLELIFPVQIPFVVISNPSHLLKIFICVGVVILAVPEMQLRLMRKTKT